ncbi:MAG: DUF1223 domain-containing protein [Pseudomonadota bacterium]
MLRALLLASLVSFPAFATDKIVVQSADTRTAVVELYTSEGCSSCPPADRWLNQLVRTKDERLDLLALAFHVDYWNYLGWKDRFSHSDYTSRQRLLGANNLQRTIYTPEFFVDGMETRGAGKVLHKIQQANQQKAPLDLELSVSRNGNQLELMVHSPGDRSTIGSVHHRYFVYENALATKVKAGENAGEYLHHEQVVRYMSEAKPLNRQNNHKINIDPDWNSANIGVAVVATSPGNQHYLQAVHTPIAKLLIE